MRRALLGRETLYNSISKLGSPSSPDMLYRCVLSLEGSTAAVEILDPNHSCLDTRQDQPDPLRGDLGEDPPKGDPHMHWAEAFVVVYSVADKKSFLHASETLQVRKYE